MKNMKNHRYELLLAGLLVFLLPFASSAQTTNNRRGQNKSTAEKTASLTTNIKAVVVDKSGNPIRNVAISSGESERMVYTDKSGEFSLAIRKDAIIFIEAVGYESKIINLSKGNFPQKITLYKKTIFTSEKDQINRSDGGISLQHDLVGVSSKISGESLISYPDILLSNSLQGRGAGLVTFPTIGGLGDNNSIFYLRGSHTKGNNQAIVVIDGLERTLDDLLAEEIETIELLKDPTTKILYGPRAANGVIWVTTKRGLPNRRIMRFSAEGGVNQLTRQPEYLNSYEYSRLYNEARQNDGFSDFYTPQQIEGYRNSSGVNDFSSPNVDYYNEFLKQQSQYRKVTMELLGGDNDVQYALIAGYSGNGGFEKIGTTPDLNKLNVRGNLDVKVTDYLTVSGGIVGRLNIRTWGSLNQNQIFSALSTHRPNEYPFTIDPENIGIPVDSSGVPAFGGSLYRSNNLYADIIYGGTSIERFLNSQANLGMNFTLDKILKGLKASAYVSFDNNSYFMEGQRNVYPTYAVNTYLNESGIVDTLITELRKRELQTNQSRLGERALRTSGWRANTSYENQFGLHGVSAVLAYNFYKNEVRGENQDQINANYSLRLNYAYDKKYLFEVDVAHMGSNRFIKGNQYFTSTAIGGAWVISNEKFLKQSAAIDFLKVKASYGLLGYDGGTSSLLYKTAWENGGTALLGEQNQTTSSKITDFIIYGNPNLKWEKSSEFNVGVEGLFFENKLRAEINYFNELRYDIIGYKSSDYADYIGGFHRNTNMGKVQNGGFEGTIDWSDNVGDFSYNVGLNFIWSRNKLVEWDQLDYTESYLNMLGQPSDVMVGYEALGLFGKDVPLEGHAIQSFGAYQEGDIAYADLNNDDIIDERDRKVLGNSFPRISLGLNLDLKYKQVGLSMLGVAKGGFNVWTTNNYYWNKGEDKYSALTMERYHAVNNPDGSYPRLSTTTGTNNFVYSSFWLKNGTFFRLKNVELYYSMDYKFIKPIANELKFFIRGANLFVLSNIKELDPELINAGVTNYPVYMTITGGIAIKF